MGYESPPHPVPASRASPVAAAAAGFASDEGWDEEGVDEEGVDEGEEGEEAAAGPIRLVPLVPEA